MGENGRRVFLSYVREDAELANAIADRLGRAGFDAWSDRRVQVGELWEDAFEDAVRNADIYIILASPEALESNASFFEIGIAVGRVVMERHVRVVPVLVRGAKWMELPRVLRLYAGIDGSGMSPAELADEVGAALATVAA